MRVISGRLGGRNFDSPQGHRTHPMSEKVRGALFNSLGDIEGLTLLDPFAGSGAFSIEAISRGAKSATAIDVDKNANNILKKNIESLKIIDSIKPIRANASAWSNRHQNEQFDLVLCDPPYDDIQYRVIRKLTKHVKQGGIFTISLPGNHENLSLDGFDIVKIKDFVDAQLVFYRRIS